MLAMETNEATSEAMATACCLAETFRRTLIVVHARRPEEAVAFLNPAATTLEQLGASGRNFPVRCIVKDGKPGDAIVEAIAQYQPSVLVVGVKRTSETSGPHGTAFSILARSRVPVLCVPPLITPEPQEENLAHVPAV